MLKTVLVLLFCFCRQCIPFECKMDPEGVVYGGVEKDGIRSIDRPGWDTLETTPLGDDEYILGITELLDGRKLDTPRAYPRRLVDWHEIVNDQSDDEHFSLTYCPLTAAGILYSTEDMGEDVVSGSELGTSGRLYQNNLVFYDRETDHEWTQMLGCTSSKPNFRLTQLPIVETTLGRWKKLYPNTDVQSFAGWDSALSHHAYPGYETSSSIWFPTTYDDTMEPYNLHHPKSRVLVLDVNNNIHLFNLDVLREFNVLNIKAKDEDDAVHQDKKDSHENLVTHFIVIYDELNEERLTVAYNAELDGHLVDLKSEERDADGFLTFVDTNTEAQFNIKGECTSGVYEGSSLSPQAGYVAYWFAVTAFHPESIIIRAEDITTTQEDTNVVHTEDVGIYDVPEPSWQSSWREWMIWFLVVGILFGLCTLGWAFNRHRNKPGKGLAVVMCIYLMILATMGIILWAIYYSATQGGQNWQLALGMMLLGIGLVLVHCAYVSFLSEYLCKFRNPRAQFDDDNQTVEM